jgi:type II secretory pathway pseudopilin PulG
MRSKTFHSDSSGGVAPLLAIALVPLLTAVGAAVDYSRANAAKVSLQAALDAAVLEAAAAAQLPTVDRAAASRHIFASNFHYPDPPTPNITIAADGMVTGEASYQLPTRMMSIVNVEFVKISAFSSAAGTGSQACVHLLEREGIGLYVNSDAKLNASCGLQVNSSSKEAIYANSGSSIKATDIAVNGQVFRNGGSSITPPPKTGSVAAADPLAHVPEPAEATAPCQFTDLTVNGGSRTLGPGVYCKKLTINSNARVTLLPGIYVFRQGEFLINSQSSVVGNDVMLYFADKDSRLNVNSDSVIQLTGRTSGTHKGFVLFQSRNASTLEADFHIINSHSTSYLEGVIYAPNGKLKFNSHSDMNAKANFTTIVARHMELNSFGTLQLNAEYQNGTPPPTPVVRLTK